MLQAILAQRPVRDHTKAPFNAIKYQTVLIPWAQVEVINKRDEANPNSVAIIYYRETIDGEGGVNVAVAETTIAFEMLLASMGDPETVIIHGA
jgi:hypothetical protein